jgi:predicted nucleic acid-binding protein
MVVYIDTSVIVSAIDRGDERNRDADKFLLREKEKVISPLVLIEIFSVVSRNSDRLISGLDLEINEEDLPAVITRLGVKKYELNLLYSFDKEFTIFGEVPAEIKLAFTLAPKLKLRTLDLLHLSNAWNFKLNGYGVDEFATFDNGILRKTGKIEELTGIRVIEP